MSIATRQLFSLAIGRSADQGQIGYKPAPQIDAVLASYKGKRIEGCKRFKRQRVKHDQIGSGQIGHDYGRTGL